MELSEILTLFDRFDTGTAAELQLTRGGDRLILRRSAPDGSSVPPAQTAPAAASKTEPQATISARTINAPLVGTFYAAPSPEAAPFAAVGATVRRGEPVCLLEAMKMMSEVPAPCDCVIEEILAQNGAAVAYDAPLFRIREL